MTNFATWIDSGNERAPIAQRGHSRQKRADLRIVGLGLIVSTDGGVPLVSRAYPGNKPDVTQFPAMVEELVARFVALVGAGAPAEERLTLVYDAGQNSGDNYELLDRSKLSFVGSLPPSDHPGLLAVAKEPLPGRRQGALPRSYRVRDEKGGLRQAAPPGRLPLRRPARQAVPGLRPDPRQGTSPARRGAGPPGTGQDPRKEKVEAEIAAIVAPRWVARVVATTVTGDDAGRAAPGLPHRRPRPRRARRRALPHADPLHRQDQGASDDRPRSSPTTAPRRRSRAISAR